MSIKNRLKIVLDSEIGFKDIDKAMVGLTSLFTLASVHKNVVYVDLKARDDASFLLDNIHACLLYTSPSPRDRQKSRMPSSA